MSSAGRPGGVPRVSTGYSNYVLGLLFVVYVFNFIDRQVLAILLPSIKAEMDVSDTYMGFLTGPAFVLFYTFAGIPIARFADRTSRRSVIALGLVVWTAMTAASGLVRSFWQLAAARVGVGIGEAAGSPAGPLAHLRLLPAGAARHGALHLRRGGLPRRGGGLSSGVATSVTISAGAPSTW